MMELSIIIPSFNASKILSTSLPPLLRYLQERSIRSEVVVVDDGSVDAQDTERVATMLGCRFLRNPQNMGKGAALKLGMLSASGLVRIFTDADIPFGLTSIEHFYQLLRFSDYEVAIGDRTLHDSEYASRISLKRAVASRLFRFAVGHDLTSRFPDTQCGLKGYKDHVAQELFGQLKTSGFAFDVELLRYIKQAGYKVKRLPVKLQNQGKSTVRIFSHGPQMLRDLLKMRSYGFVRSANWRRSDSVEAVE